MLVPIRKPSSDSGQCRSFRPISLLLAFDKMFEFFIVSRIRDVVDDRGLVRDCQLGFRQ